MPIISQTTTTYTAIFTLVPDAPVAIKPPKQSNTPITLHPSSIALYHGFDGSISPPASHGEISRNPASGRDTSTLVTFDLAGRSLPPTCALRFHLDPSDRLASCSGSGYIDVFSSLQPPPIEGSKGWGGPGNQRNLPLGRMQVRAEGAAKVLDHAPNLLGSLACLQVEALGGQHGVLAFELVPVGDWDRVTWGGGKSGLRLSW